jgi:hypothetical protein
LLPNAELFVAKEKHVELTLVKHYMDVTVAYRQTTLRKFLFIASQLNIIEF